MKNILSYNEFLNESIDSKVRSKIIKTLKNNGLENRIDYKYAAGHFITDTIEKAEEIADAVGDKFKVTILDRKNKDGDTLIMITENLNEEDNSIKTKYNEMSPEEREKTISENNPDLLKPAVIDYSLKQFEELPPEIQRNISKSL